MQMSGIQFIELSGNSAIDIYIFLALKVFKGHMVPFVYNTSLSVLSNVFLKTSSTNLNFNKIEETIAENLSLIYQGTINKFHNPTRGGRRFALALSQCIMPST